MKKMKIARCVRGPGRFRGSSHFSRKARDASGRNLNDGSDSNILRRVTMRHRA